MLKSIDSRFGHVHSIYKAGDLKDFVQIFVIIPKSVVAKVLGVNISTLGKKMLRPQLFTLEEILHLAKLFDMPHEALAKLMVDAVVAND